MIGRLVLEKQLQLKSSTSQAKGPTYFEQLRVTDVCRTAVNRGRNESISEPLLREETRVIPARPLCVGKGEGCVSEVRREHPNLYVDLGQERYHRVLEAMENLE